MYLITGSSHILGVVDIWSINSINGVLIVLISLLLPIPVSNEKLCYHLLRYSKSSIYILSFVIKNTFEVDHNLFSVHYIKERICLKMYKSSSTC